MKKDDTHPKYNDKVTAKCGCGAQFLVGSTKDGIKTEICSNCHPFFTGKQKLVDTAGRVDRFEAKRKKAAAAAQKKKKAKTDDEDTTDDDATDDDNA